MKLETKFDIRDRVIINGDRALTAVVQRVMVSSSAHMYEVSWFDANGDFREHWMYEWQLALVTPRAVSTAAEKQGQSMASFDYVNYRGEKSWRSVLPTGLRFGENEYHKDAQFLLLALDVDRGGAEREFAIRDMSNVSPGVFLP
jgi:hypothetical protein